MPDPLPSPPAPRPPAPHQRAARVFVALVLREMATRFRRSQGGYMWALAEPVAMITLLSIAFSLIIKMPALGTSFVLFYASGYLPFHVYKELSATTAQAVRFNRALLGFPVVTPTDAVLARAALNLAMALAVCLLVLGGILLLMRVQVNLDAAALLTGFAMAAALGVGLGALNCVLFAFSGTYEQLFLLASRPLFLLSGVFYTFESLPPMIREILWFNPLIHVVGQVRTGVYGSYRGDYVSHSYVFGLAAGLLVLGLWLLRRHRARLADPVNA